MTPKDYSCYFNTGTSVAAVAGKQIYITNVTAGFTALGVAVPVGANQVLNFSSPLVIPTGGLSSLTTGTVFYFIS